MLRNNKSLLLDEHFAAVEEAREESVLILRNFYKSEEIFLDMFEDEYRQMIENKLNFEFIISDASLLLPPTGTPLTYIDIRSVIIFHESLKRTFAKFYVVDVLTKKAHTTRAFSWFKAPLLTLHQQTPVKYSVLNVKVVVAAFNQELAVLGTFSVSRFKL